MKNHMFKLNDLPEYNPTKFKDIFGFNNSKLNHCAKQYGITKLVSWSIPAGWTCPAANICLSMANRESGHITDGESASVRCYKASSEATYTNTRNLAWNNLSLSVLVSDFIERVNHEIKRYKVTSIRVHEGGDFYNMVYLKAWVQIARMNPSVEFWGYTKKTRLC